jgi:hypothetical protein
MTYLHSKPLPRPSANPLPRPPAFYSLNVRTTITIWAAVKRTLSRLDRYTDKQAHSLDSDRQVKARYRTSTDRLTSSTYADKDR